MLPLIACRRCAASGRGRAAELVPLDDRGRPQAATVARLRHWTPLVEDLPCGPTAPCPVCHGHRLVPRRGRRPYASARPGACLDRRRRPGRARRGQPRPARRRAVPGPWLAATTWTVVYTDPARE